MRRRVLPLAAWLLGLAAVWLAVGKTVHRPPPFDPAAWDVVGRFGDGPLVAVAARAGHAPRGYPLHLSSGPVEVWDLAAGQRVSAHPVVPPGWRYNGWPCGRWLRVLPADPDGRYGPPALFDLTDGREVCRAADSAGFWSKPTESAGRLVVWVFDTGTGECTTTAFDPATGATAWTVAGEPVLTAGRHVVTWPYRVNQRAPPAGPLTVRASADGVVLGVIPTTARPAATDGRVVLTADGRVWDVATGRVRFDLPGYEADDLYHRPGFTADGNGLVVGLPTPAGPAVCWIDLTTGSEYRRVPVPAAPSSASVVVDGAVVSVRCAEWPGPGVADRLRDLIPFVPPRANFVPDRPQTVVYRFDAATGRRRSDGHPDGVVLVARPDGRPLLTDATGTAPARVWVDRPGWHTPALAAGWTTLVLGVARLRRRRT